MPGYRIERGERPSGFTATRVTLIVLALVILLGARSLASFAIEIEWWKELGQFDTWLSMLAYSMRAAGRRHPARLRACFGWRTRAP